MSTTAVEKGLQFEKAVVDMLNKCGFKAWRTNQSNEADPERYKAVFVDRSQFFAIFDIGLLEKTGMMHILICREISMTVL